MGAGGTKQGESGVPSKQGQLQFDDDIFEETIDTEMIERQEKDKRQAFCDLCFIDGLMNVIAFYMCVVCEKYICKECFKRHNKRDKSHKVVRVKSKSGENDGFNDFISVMMNESEKERKEGLRKTNVFVSDYEDTKHNLDKDKNCFISGLIGYDNKWWIVCDSSNSCIKIFSLWSNVLQRYIRFRSLHLDVTEITVKDKTAEQDLASFSKTAISRTENKPERKHLLAVTLPFEHQTLIIDLNKIPAVIHNKIKTEKRCFSIDFYDGNIYIVCKKRPRDSHCSVSIMTAEGVTLKAFKSDFRSLFPYLTVLNGNIYMTDTNNHRVVCYNDEGRVLHEIKIDRSWSVGICVDCSEDKVYICAQDHDKVYKLESDLSQYKSVLDQTTRCMELPDAMCFYSDRLYVGNLSYSQSGSHVTVVRLL